MKKFLIHNYTTFFLIFFLFTFALLSFVSATRESLTFDEIVDLQEGRNAILFHTFNIDPYNPPLTREIGIFPYIFTQKLYTDGAFAQNHPLAGRVSMILISISLLIGVYFFVKKYFGLHQALFATLLASFEPNLLANSHYITMDVGLTAIIFFSFVLLLRFLNRQNVQNALFLAVAVGAGMVTKISYIPFFFTSAVIITFIKNKTKAFFRFRQKFFAAVLSALFVVSTIWLAYFLSPGLVIKPRADVSRVSVKTVAFAKSHHVAFLANAVLFFEKTKIPLGDYLATIKNNTLRSLSHSTCFSLGKFYSSCQWYFMLETVFLKLPLSLFIFFSVSIVLFFQERRKEKISIYILIFIGIILLTAVVFRLPPLIRYILPVVPFVIIFASSALSFWMQTKLRKIVFALLVAWYLFSGLSVFPHFITYANELAFNQKSFLLTDSNMDWGQNLPDVAVFLQQNKIRSALFSYSGRDNGDLYGLKSDREYGSYKENEICEFHQIGKPKPGQPVLIGATNWYNCGYFKNPKFAKSRIAATIADTVFVFQK